jgi:hypothetical protein
VSGNLGHGPEHGRVIYVSFLELGRNHFLALPGERIGRSGREAGRRFSRNSEQAPACKDKGQQGGEDEEKEEGLPGAKVLFGPCASAGQTLSVCRQW